MDILKKILQLKNNIYFINIITTILIFLLIFLLKEIYPFGNNTISNCDMNQSYLTFYYYLWDIFHNGKNIFYNFELGMGSNIYGGFVSDGFFNPTSWLILFSSRDNILYNMSFIIIIKFVFVSLFTTIYVQKVFPNVDIKLKFISVIMYTFSGYLLINYSNLMWIDIVALFPLFCLGLNNILKYNKMFLFTFILGLCLINNYNLSWMILFFIFFAVPFLIKYKAVNKRKATSQIILGTLLSIGISAFAFIPTFLQTMSSYRMKMSVGYIMSSPFYYKLFNGLFYTLPIIYLLKMVKDYKKDTNVRLIFLTSLTTFILPVIFEKINLLWHTGSYQCFGFRYGFIINFILMNTLLYGYSKYGFEELKLKFKNILFLKINFPLFLISIMVFIPSMIYFIYVFINSINQIFPFYFSNQIILFEIIFLTSLFIYMYLIKIKKIDYIVLFTLILVICYGCSFFGNNPNLDTLERNDQSVLNMVMFSNELNITDNYRLKDLTLSMTENYPLVVNVASPSTFLHIISESQVLNYYQMGYSGVNTKLNDLGGTILSDSIYGIKYIISDEQINNNVYEFYKKIDNYFIYKNPYTRFIYTVDTSLSDEITSNNLFDANNELTNELFGKEKVLKSLVNNCTTLLDRIKCEYDLNNEELYFTANKYVSDIVVNGKTIKIKEIDNPNNEIYYYDLGYYNSKVTIELGTNSIENIYFSTINMQDYKKLFSNLEEIKYEYDGNKMKIYYNNVDNHKGLFIPINYDEGFSAKLNGSNVNVYKKLNNFMYIELVEGENYIELEFYPKMFKICLIFSIITALLLAVIFIHEKKRNYNKEYKFITYPLYYIGIIIVILVTSKVYIIPIIQTFIN